MLYSSVHGYNFSKLTLGSVALGINYGIANKQGKPSEKEGCDILSTAFNAGINCIDTARDYGTAEQLIGNYRHSNGIGSEIHIVTKFKISPQNISGIHNAKDEAFRSIRNSLRFLRLDQIPICLFHMDRTLPVKQVIKVLFPILSDLKSAGLINLAGISIDHPNEVVNFADHPLIDALQIPANIFDQRLIKNGAIAYLKTLNKIVFVRSIFLQGLFFVEANQLTGNLEEASPYLNKLNSFASEIGMNIAQVAFSYVRDLEGVTSLVLGVENAVQVRQNIKLLHGSALNASDRETLNILFKNVPENIITPRYWISN